MRLGRGVHKRLRSAELSLEHDSIGEWFNDAVCEPEKSEMVLKQ